jgi:predicted dehydrogenase
MSRVLVIGYGSIGKRHARLLAESGATVACVTRNRECPFTLYPSIAGAVTAFRPSHVLISNETVRHAPALEELGASGWRGPVLVEKPLFDGTQPFVPPSGMTLSVAFNLRFHPLVAALKSRLAGRELHSAAFYVGQYLPDWRPHEDYRQSYSASRAAGGGVLRDLSHELDLAACFCGPLQKVVGLGGKFSGLEIDSDDVFHILATAERCRAVNIVLNYLDRPARRVLTLNGPALTVVLDFIAGTLMVNDELIMAKPERDATYTAQIADFLRGEDSTVCSFSEGRHVDSVIAAVETSVRDRCWISVAAPSQ